MSLQIKRKVLWFTAVTAYLLTWLPNFGILNELIFISIFPLPLAWVLFLNVILTACVYFVYKLHFLPLEERVNKMPLEEYLVSKGLEEKQKNEREVSV